MQNQAGDIPAVADAKAIHIDSSRYSGTATSAATITTMGKTGTTRSNRVRMLAA
jgi:hypothetical protein